MQSYNFEFLRPHHADLADFGALAENFLYLDAASALVKMRLFGETATDLIYREMNLPRPFNAQFYDLLNETAFKNAVDTSVYLKLDALRKLGNKAAHGKSFTTAEAMPLLRETHTLACWLFLTFFGGRVEALAEFAMPPKPQDIREKFQQELETKSKEIERLAAEARKANEQKQAAEKSLEELREIAAAGARAATVLHFDEAETRRRLIDQMLLAAGWQVGTNSASTEQVGQEVYLRSTKEKVDYVLYHDNGSPLAVIEAKRTAEDAEAGRTQAKLYADVLEAESGQRPVIFYTNGFDIYIWNDAVGETPRKLYGFYSKDSLEYLIFKRENRMPLEDLQPNSEIINRIYQIEAVKRVTEKFTERRRKALIVQATGTGKTRVAAAICELLTRARWAKRILFLCDRRELRKQADNVFKEFLPGEPRAVVSSFTAGERDKRIYLATYPAMMECFESFDVGFFDLIIADESHRSIYNRYRDLFLYFDALEIGLTATPVKHIGRSTYQLFGCEDEDPTAYYSYEQAISHEPRFLTPFEVFDATTDFLRRGIKYNQLSKGQQEQLEETEGEEAALFDYEKDQINNLVFNRQTNEYILRNLMEKGIRDQSGQRVGKTIIFARNHNHAVFLEQLFNEMYPQYGGEFCRVIDSHDARAEHLIDDFKGINNNSKIQIAVSVDMLDTGIDIPEIVNLVFAKPVKSYVKFWQMIGRGTRLCPHLFGLGEDKEKFYIFDHCGNFEYFNENYTEAAPSQSKSLVQRVFEARVALASAALDVQNKEVFDKAIDLVAQDIAALPESSIAVRERWRELAELKTENVLLSFTAPVRQLLARDIAPLMQWRNITGAEKSYEFDLLVAKLETERLKKSAAFDDLRDAARASLSRLPVNLNEVREKSDLVERVKSAQFWETAEAAEIEAARRELRGLMPLAQNGTAAIFPRVIDVEDVGVEFKRLRPKLEGLELIAYKKRVQEVLENLLDESEALQKIKRGEAVSGSDFDELCALVLAQDPEIDLRDLHVYFPDLAENLDVAIRSIIGLHAEAVNARFERFVQEHNLNAKQLRFLQMLQNHLTRYGSIEIARLYDTPFTTIDAGGLDGVFSDEKQISEILNILALLDNKQSSINASFN